MGFDRNAKTLDDKFYAVARFLIFIMSFISFMIKIMVYNQSLKIMAVTL